MKRLVLFFSFLGLFVFHRVLADSGAQLEIRSQTGESIQAFTPFTESPAGSVAAADLGHDGTAEILVGAGYGSQPLVRVYRQDGSFIGEFLAYDDSFTGGVNVTSCDLDGDGQSEIITGAGFGGGPHVRIFTNEGISTGISFFAYPESFLGGVNVACGDVTGDGKPEIVTGAGITGGPHVRVFDASGNLLGETFTGDAHQPTGAFVTLGNFDHDDALEIASSPMTHTQPVVTFIDWSKNHLVTQKQIAVGKTLVNGLPITAFDEDHDGLDEIAYTHGAFADNSISFLHTNGSIASLVDKQDITMHNTLIATLKDQSAQRFLILSGSTPLSPNTDAQYINVDLSEQRLTAFSNGVPVNSFLVSTGIRGRETPVGTYSVTDKIPIMDYVWNYGPGNPNNYNLPNVKYNLRFKQHFYIHSAYWHNNFGHPMSHGCVNVSIPNAEWIFNWADIGATVEVQS